MSASEQITATVSKLRYPKTAADFTGFAVLKTDRGTVVGEFAWLPKIGQTFDLSGAWQYSAKHHGEQFRARSARLVMPTDPRDLLHYACSITDGIGPAKEAEIWLRFGDRWQAATDLDGIGGIRPGTRNAWQANLMRLESERAQAAAIAYLLGLGCTMKAAEAAWGQWQESTVGIVEGNVYNLAELRHYGFYDVDTGPRVVMGISDDDPRRHKAAVIIALKTILTTSGNTIATFAELATGVARLIGVDFNLPEILTQLSDHLVDVGGNIARRNDWTNAGEILARMEETL